MTNRTQYPIWVLERAVLRVRDPLPQLCATPRDGVLRTDSGRAHRSDRTRRVPAINRARPAERADRIFNQSDHRRHRRGWRA